VRGCENLEFANPRGLADEYSYFTVQSKDIFTPVQSIDDQKDLICYGESFKSLRSVLRRYNLLESYPLNETNTTSAQLQQTFWFKKFPYSPGFNLTTAPYATQAKGIVATSTNFLYTYCHMTALAWMSGAYLGRRGSVRYAFNLTGASMSAVRSAKVFRSLARILNTGGLTSSTAAVGLSAAAYMNALFIQDTGNGFEGMLLFDNSIQSGITVELPQYINNRFEICDPITGNMGQADDSSDRETYGITLTSQPAKYGAQTGTLNKFVAMGTDFTFFFYLNAPMVNLNTKGPAQVTPV
jgi:hypothetical protein